VNKRIPRRAYDCQGGGDFPVGIDDHVAGVKTLAGIRTKITEDGNRFGTTRFFDPGEVCSAASSGGGRL